MRSNLDEIWVDSLAYCLQGGEIADIRADKWMHLTHAIGKIIEAGGEELEISELCEAVRKRLEPLGNRNQSGYIRTKIADSIKQVDRRKNVISWIKRPSDWSASMRPHKLWLVSDPSKGIEQERFERVAQVLFKRDEALRQATELLGDDLENGSRKLVRGLGQVIFSSEAFPVSERNSDILHKLCQREEGLSIVSAERARTFGGISRRSNRFLIKTPKLKTTPELQVPFPFWLDEKIREIRRPFTEG